jgi:Membrane bound O-acyl transferase family
VELILQFSMEQAIAMPCFLAGAICARRAHFPREKERGKRLLLSGMALILALVATAQLSLPAGYRRWWRLGSDGEAPQQELYDVSPATMMSVSLGWILGVRLVSIALFGGTAVAAGSDSESGGVFHFLCRDVFWYALPVTRAPAWRPRLVPSNPSTFLPFARSFIPFALRMLALVASKVLVSKLIFLYLSRCVSDDDTVSLLLDAPAGLMWYTSVFATFVVSSAFSMDIQRIVVAGATGGRFEVPAFSRSPPLAGSLSEFWGLRYNRLVHTLLVDSAYRPLVRLGWSRAVGTAAAFVISGLLHVNVVFSTFGPERVPHAFLFFMLQLVPLLVLERGGAASRHAATATAAAAVRKKDDDAGNAPAVGGLRRKPPPYSLFGNIATLTFLVLTLPLYVGTMVLHGPRWFQDPAPSLDEYVPLQVAFSQAAGAVPCYSL